MARPPKELTDFAKFCGQLTLENRKPFKLEPFQRKLLWDYFTGCRETLVLLPKKNGKSTLLGALALHHLITCPEAECVIAAASRDQAEILYRQAGGFVRRSDWLQDHVVVKTGYREIRNIHDHGRVRVMASDEHTADGVIPTLALVDELHRHRSPALYGVFRDGLGPRDGRMITISTAGDDIESTLGNMRQAAYALEVKQDGAYRYARNGRFAMHEWALEPDDDVHDMQVVKRANPLVPIRDLRERHDSPSMTSWQWARFACGIWLQGENTAISPVEWAACAATSDPPDDLHWRIGLDIGWDYDTTATVPVAVDDDGVVWLGQPRVLVPPTKSGVSLRKRQVLDVVVSLCAEYGTHEVVMDPANEGRVVAQDLEETHGLDVTAHSQQPKPMSEAAENFHAAIREGKLRHPNDPVLSRHILNAHRKWVGDGRWTFVKENKLSKKHIDALIAATIAYNVTLEHKPSVYETRGMLSFQVG